LIINRTPKKDPFIDAHENERKMHADAVPECSGCGILGLSSPHISISISTAQTLALSTMLCHAPLRCAVL
jgi:hypothetical protein